MPEVSQRVEIPQTGEAANRHDPPCVEDGRNAGQIILKAGAAAIDAYIGQPLVSGALEHLPQGNRQWLLDRLGISNGDPKCITLCLVIPKGTTPTYTISFSETGGDGYSERSSQNSPDLDGPYEGTGFCGVGGVSVAETDQAMVFCATGKNWSHNRNRWFQIKAVY